MAYHYPRGVAITTCALAECDQPRGGRHKLCATHLSRKYAGRPLRPAVPARAIPEATRTTRFWAKIDQTGGLDACWPWIGNRIAKGYGIFTYRGRNFGAHRTAYELAIGLVPNDQWVLHHCDNPPCCNPTHLFLGDAQANVDDMLAKGRASWQKGAVGV